MQLTCVIIHVWRGKAYLPVQGQFESGIFVDVGPVYTADLTVGDLVSAAEKVLKAGHPRLPRPTPEEMRQRKSPLLASTKAGSWKKLERTGTMYAISWTEKEIRVDMSRSDKKRRGEFDPAKIRIFPPDTPLEDIMTIVLQDVQSRPILHLDE